MASSTALFAGDDRHTRVYGAQRRRFQRSPCAGKSGQVAQLVERRERDWEAPLLEALQSVGGPNPDARAGLQTVIDGFLFGGSAGQEEMRVEALRRRLRRNPVREIDEEIGRQDELFGARHLQQRDALFIQRLAVASKARRTAPVKREHMVIPVGKQYIRLLKKLTNGRGPDAVAEGGLSLYIRRRWRNGPAYPGSLLGQAISRRDGAAGEDKNIRHKLALGDAPDHKYLYSFRSDGATGRHIPAACSVRRSAGATEPPGKTKTSGINSLWATRRTINTSIPSDLMAQRAGISRQPARSGDQPARRSRRGRQKHPA